MTCSLRFTPLLLCVFVVACGDDTVPAADAGADTGALDAGSDAATDAAMDAGSDATTDDAATDSGVTCYPLSGPSPSLPDAIPSEFTATSPTWSRPTGETCRATRTGPAQVLERRVGYAIVADGAEGTRERRATPLREQEVASYLGEARRPGVTHRRRHRP